MTVCCSDDDDDDVFFLLLYVSLGLAPAGLWVRTLHTLVSFTLVTSFLRSRAHLFLLFCFSVVEFKDEEFVKKAIEVMNKHDLNGRPLNIKEVNVCSEHASCHAVCNSHTRLCVFQDPDGEHARRVLHRSAGKYSGGRGQDSGPGGINVPPSIANNPNIPPEIINALQAGRLGTTVFVANVSHSLS